MCQIRGGGEVYFCIFSYCIHDQAYPLALWKEKNLQKNLQEGNDKDHGLNNYIDTKAFVCFPLK